VAPQFSGNRGQKLFKVQKSADMFVRTILYRYLRDLKKNPLQYFRARNVDEHLYKFFLPFAIQRQQQSSSSSSSSSSHEQLSNFAS